VHRPTRTAAARPFPGASRISAAGLIFSRKVDSRPSGCRCQASGDNLRALPAPTVPHTFSSRNLGLNSSLSVLLPVHNAQANLESDVATILDVLPELSREFDVVIIDDASTDATWEIAEDLACRYPQVTIARQPIRQGPAVALRTGTRAARGSTVIAHDGHRGVDPQQVVRIWRDAEARGICASALAQRRAVPRPLASAMLDAARSGEIVAGGFKLVQPRTVDEIRRDAPSSYERLFSPRPRTAAVVAERTSAELTTADRPTAPHAPQSGSAKKPNFLSRIRSRMKEIALGE
jgi:hypothetical protein